MTARRSAERGFSLAEVVVALGLLASVLISVAGLLVMGNRLVSRGRGTTQALEVARDVLEEMRGWSFTQLHSTFGCDPGKIRCEVVIDKDDPSPPPGTEAWHARLAETRPAGCVATLRLETVDELTLETTDAIRVRIEIAWREGLSQRSLELSTVRM